MCPWEVDEAATKTTEGSEGTVHLDAAGAEAKAHRARQNEDRLA
ncbi:hypothetical protein [Nocardiopsis dassonvillei]